MDFVRINPNDNVEVSLENGHKYAVRDIKKGESVIKYGFPIGSASADIAKGEHVHSHNLKTALGEIAEYEYAPDFKTLPKIKPAEFTAYARRDGRIGIRNDIWIIPTVGCVSHTAEIIAEKTGAFAFCHPYGCSQLGDDLETTRKILSGLITHPNAGGVLVLGLGCENNGIDSLKAALGGYDSERIKFLNAQDCADEVREGVNIIKELTLKAAKDKKIKTDISKLVIGLKCGGSDGLSGITANPLVGRTADIAVSMGAAAVMTEVPEMFGAEQILFNRCESRAVFEKSVSLINNFKNYFISHSQPVSENPSPGNQEGGITTLEEKSLGCVQKGGTSPVTDVLLCGDKARKSGLNLLYGPGNDMVAVTNLTAAGCHIILFTTGRGTPLGAPVPVLKISTNTSLYNRKRNWIDFDAEPSITDSKAPQKLFDQVIKTADGQKTLSEQNSHREIAIFKNGVTL